jgi:hypothetical protein
VRRVRASMTVYGTSPIKRIRRTKAEIEALDAGLSEIVEQFSPATVRQVFYQGQSRPRTQKRDKGLSCRAAPPGGA